MRTRRLAPWLLAAGLALAGCAELACRPVTIVVADRERRTRLESEFRGVTTDPTGRVVERRRDVVVDEFWVKDGGGRWYRGSEAAWRGAIGGGGGGGGGGGRGGGGGGG